jgi:hypothetical protein
MIGPTYIDYMLEGFKTSLAEWYIKNMKKYNHGKESVRKIYFDAIKYLVRLLRAI